MAGEKPQKPQAEVMNVRHKLKRRLFFGLIGAALAAAALYLVATHGSKLMSQRAPVLSGGADNRPAVTELAPAGVVMEPTATPTSTLTPTPTVTPTPEPTSTPTPEAIQVFANTLQQWIEEGRTVEEQEIFDWFNDGDELEFYDTLESARFYLGHLLEVAGVLDYLKQTGAYDQVGIAIKTTFTPTKRSFYGAIGRFDVQFCGYLEGTNYLPLHLMPADEKTAELMDPMKLGAMGYYTGGVDLTWYGHLGPFKQGERRYDYPGHQQFFFFDRQTGEPLGMLDMQTLFDEDLYWNDFKKRGRGLWSPYKYKGTLRPVEEDEFDFIAKCYSILREQK